MHKIFISVFRNDATMFTSNKHDVSRLFNTTFYRNSLFFRKVLLFSLTPTIPGWWYISWSGGIGWVPANYLRPVDGAQPDMTPCDGG